MRKVNSRCNKAQKLKETDHLVEIVTSFIDDAEGKQAECTVRLLIMKYDNHFMDGNFDKVRKWVGLSLY
jgi:hypothetical protein